MSNLIRNEPKGPDCREKYSRDWGIAFPWFKGYNEAMAKWLSGIKLQRPEEPFEIDVIYQTPERAFADLLSNRVNGQIVLPHISFTMTGSSFDWSRFSSPPQIVYSRRQIGDRWQLEPKPMPWTLNYNVTVWAKFQEDLDLIAYRILSRFTPDSYLYAYGAPALITLTGHTDTSELESSEGDRVLRNDYQFDVAAWMQLPFREIGRVESAALFMTGDEDEDIDIQDVYSGVRVYEGDFSYPENDSSSGVQLTFDFEEEI